MSQYHFPASSAARLEPYLPSKSCKSCSSSRICDDAPPRPFVTLTFVTSLDSALTITPGRPTTLSGPEAMAMTHFLRSRHDAILVGVGTLLADNSSLNCRLGGLPEPHRIRPVIVDPHSRWDMDPQTSKVLRLAAEGLSLAPYVISRRRPEAAARLEELGGKVIVIETREATQDRDRFKWSQIFAALGKEGLASIMVEGGAVVINSLLGPDGKGSVDSIIVTLAPKWLGEGSLFVRPARSHDENRNAIPAITLRNVAWHPLGRDVVLSGKLQGTC